MGQDTAVCLVALATAFAWLMPKSSETGWGQVFGWFLLLGVEAYATFSYVGAK